MKTKCSKCSNQTESYNLSGYGECPDCKRRRDGDDEASQHSSQQAYNMVTGDMFNTGIPGGIDMDMTTPL